MTIDFDRIFSKKEIRQNFTEFWNTTVRMYLSNSVLRIPMKTIQKFVSII